MRKVLSATALATAGKLEAGLQDGVQNARSITAYVVYNVSTSAGSVLVEGAHDKSYAGTWDTLGTVAWAAATRAHKVTVAGPHNAIRIRVVTVTGGTVDAHLVLMD